ncbi:MAG: hypothetical protein ACP5LX_05675, partial [Nitrososphaeria archaeon]
MSRNKKISVKISLKGDKRTVESLKKALDGSKVVDNILIIVFDSDDIGDARAFINSTLRVIN